ASDARDGALLKEGITVPTRDLTDGVERLLERHRVHQLLNGAHPQPEQRIEVDDAPAMLPIATGRARASILRQGQHEGIIRWRMAAPDGEGVPVVEPDSIEEFPQLVTDKLDTSE